MIYIFIYFIYILYIMILELWERKMRNNSQHHYHIIG